MQRMVAPRAGTLLLGILAATGAAAESRLYLGTYGPGIYRSTFDPNTGVLTPATLVAETQNPSFLTLHPSGRFLYCVSEMGQGGGLRAYAVDPNSGALTFLNQQSSGGAGPCYVSLDRSARVLLAANYGSGSVTALPLDARGRLQPATSRIQHTGVGIDPQRQKGPHAHCIDVSPDQRFALAADLGIDKVLVYRLDPSAGTLTPHDPACASLAPGAGPRHLVFAPDGHFVYVINELNSTVTAFAWDNAKGTLTEIQTLRLLPAEFRDFNKSAEIAVHPNGRVLYASNRGHDSLAVCAIDPNEGTLRLIEHATQGIRTPRHFSLDPTGRFCLVANQDDDSVVVFRIDPNTGCLHPTGHRVTVPKPVCLRFAP